MAKMTRLRSLMPVILATGFGLVVTPCGLAQSSDYHPGQPIKFGGSGSSMLMTPSSSASSTSSGASSSNSNSQTWNDNSSKTGASGGSGTSSSFSGTTYAPPSQPQSPPQSNIIDNTNSTDSVDQSSSKKGSSSRSSDSSSHSSVDTSDQPKHKGGLSSLFREVKQELNSNINVNGGRSGNYTSGQFSNGATSGGYNSQTPGYHYGGSSMTNMGFNANANSAMSSGALNYVRMPDGSYRANGPNVGRAARVQAEQNMPKLGGNIAQFVASDPPVPIEGDIENLIPRELHGKAYGKELSRNGPLNGAEDNDHLF